MNRIAPPSSLTNLPCSVTAVSCALGRIPGETLAYLQTLKSDGYATLQTANRYIRNNLPVKKRIDYRRGERPKLRDLHLDGKAVVCVYGHLVYVEGETYYSFFQNENDDVVAVWLLKGE